MTDSAPDRPAGVPRRFPSTLVLVAGLVAICGFGLAGVLFIAPGPESLQRLGLFFGLIGTAATALVAMLRAEQAATALNGTLDQRVISAVYQANAARRADDPAVRGTPPATPS